MQATDTLKEEQSGRLDSLQQQLAEAQRQSTRWDRTAQQQLQRINELESSSRDLQSLAERQELEAAAAKV